MALERFGWAASRPPRDFDEAEPAPVGGPRRTRVVALVEGLDGSRAGAVELDELLVVALEGLLAVRGDADQALQDVDRLELVGDEAAGGDLDRAFSGSFQQVEDFLAAGREAEERLGLQQEGAVVADVVDDGELLVVVRLAEASAELLEPEDPRLRGAQHEDGVELGEVEALVEDVHRADDVEAGRSTAPPATALAGPRWRRSGRPPRAGPAA